MDEPGRSGQRQDDHDHLDPPVAAPGISLPGSHGPGDVGGQTGRNRLQKRGGAGLRPPCLRQADFAVPRGGNTGRGRTAGNIFELVVHGRSS